MKISERKKKILQIVVDEYINSAVPVSSKAITERHLSGVSSATVRNELAALEELGYLTQFHTSGGRVPSPAAYRFYIEELMQTGKLSKEDLDYISAVIGKKSNDIEHIIKSVTKVISELTDYTSVAITPHAEAEKIINIALLHCGNSKALLIIITGERILRDSFVDIPADMTSQDLENVSQTLNKIFSGKALSEAKEIEEQVLAEFSEYRELLTEVIDALKTYTQTRDKDIVLSGQNKIFNHPEYDDIETVKNFISVISSKDRLAEIMDDETDEIQISVKIGSAENEDLPKDCSFVTATYSAGGINLGTYGVIGPIRMDYTKVITVLENVGKVLEDIINGKNLPSGTKGSDKK